VTTRRHLLIGWLSVLALSGCAPVAPTASPTSSPTGPDFTTAGTAASMVRQLLAKAGNDHTLMVEITRTTVQVSVLGQDHKPITWAYRNGELSEVASDLQYVDQSTFEVSRFNLSDVGGLFRAAEGQSGSAQDQSLTIVDYSGGEVMMSVSTVPESRTVFFEPDGALLPVLNFDTPDGIAQGITDAVGSRVLVHSITVQSTQGAWVDYPGDTGTTVRRTRTAKVPVTTNVTAQKEDLPLFLAVKVEPSAIWKVVDATRGSDDVAEEANWSVVIDDRDNTGVPRMYFTIGSKVLVTDIAGDVVSG
jgi:hypothetical protein